MKCAKLKAKDKATWSANQPAVVVTKVAMPSPCNMFRVLFLNVFERLMMTGLCIGSWCVLAIFRVSFESNFSGSWKTQSTAMTTTTTPAIQLGLGACCYSRNSYLDAGGDAHYCDMVEHYARWPEPFIFLPAIRKMQRLLLLLTHAGKAKVAHSIS